MRKFWLFILFIVMCVVTCGTVVDGKWKPTSMKSALERWNRRADNGK